MAIDDNEDYFRWMHNLKKIADGQKKYDEKIANQTQIDWKFWLAMPTIYDWQAALLAIKLNPDAFMPSSNSWMAGKSVWELSQFPSSDLFSKFVRVLKLIESNKRSQGFFADTQKVILSKFIEWIRGLEYLEGLPAEFLTNAKGLHSSKLVVSIPKAAGTAKRWNDSALTELADYRKKHGTKKAAEHFGISEARVRQLLPSEDSKKQPTANNPFRLSKK